MGLCSDLFSAAATAVYLKRNGLTSVEAIPASIWIPLAASFFRMHWALGLGAPSSAAQSCLATFGWDYAPATLALAVYVVPAAFAGYGIAALAARAGR